ncbi:DUF6625 family protein [Phocaeicola coprocola]|uniref:DUF6625 family protein n=1 Tax=Phocaeicola coprocola TaxID=310298 RepID=UPI0025E19867|nr:DUF6625 family protein [uncultured Phocaeicola sp.]
MKSIVFIVPYFGKFPSYFQIWLNSCKCNPTINWIIFTDIRTPYNYPDNVKVINITFEKLRNYIQSKYDFPIDLHAPYKLCDYKPAYGEIFQEYISEYDYWGHCDVDLIWGNIRHFITEQLLSKKYDKLFNFGHCILYHNTKENNQTYRSTIANIPNYRKVFSSPFNYYFDETHGVMPLFVKLNKNICNSIFCYDVKIRQYSFRPAPSMFPSYQHLKNKNGIFKKEKDSLFFIYVSNGQIQKEEFMYVHFQKRKMYNSQEINNKQEYYIIPNKFIPNFNLSKHEILKSQPKIWNLYWDLIIAEWKQKKDILLNRPRVQMYYKGRFEKVIDILLFRK